MKFKCIKVSEICQTQKGHIYVHNRQSQSHRKYEWLPGSGKVKCDYKGVQFPWGDTNGKLTIVVIAQLSVLPPPNCILSMKLYGV